MAEAGNSRRTFHRRRGGEACLARFTTGSKRPLPAAPKRRTETAAGRGKPRPYLPPLFLLLVLAGACGPAAPPDGRTAITAWFHTGRDAERRTLEAQVERFHAAQDVVAVELTLIPEGGYDIQVQSAALSGGLPCVLDFDGPMLYKYVWQGHLLPLDDLLPEATRQTLIPSILAQGTYRGRLYSVGTFDSGLGLYADRAQLARVDARIPTSPTDAWTAAEFDDLLERLAARDPDGKVLDLALHYRGEWITYGFAPILQSAGADLIDRSTYRAAGGTLDGPAAIAAMRRVAGWFERGRVHPNVDENAFQNREVALSWGGHWRYHAYAEALGDDLLLLPLPDFGTGSKTGQGSWNWGVTTGCRDPEAAVRFLSFLLGSEEVLAMAEANGAVPATGSAIERSALYGPGGPLHLFVEQLRTRAVPRPATAAYPVITAAFQAAFRDIRDGADPADALRRAAREIDEDLEDNLFYP